MKRMTVPLSQIDAHVRQMEAEFASVEEKMHRLLEMLVQVGAEVAKVRFESAMHDGGNDVKVAETGEWIDDHTIVINATGSMITFIEFGSGVFYNGAVGSSPHPKGVEMGMTIGGYGKGRGKRKAWYFYDAKGEAVKSYGNPPALAMWDASQQMREQITAIARSVFM